MTTTQWIMCSFRLHQAELDALNCLAAKEGRTRSEMLRELIERAATPERAKAA